MVMVQLSSGRDGGSGSTGVGMQPSTILFLAANPVRVQALQLGEECRAIEDKIRAARFRDQIRFRSRWAARPDDLLQALNEDTPSVLHFSGHGAGAQGLCFQSDDGSARMVSAGGLAQVMQAAGASVTVVVLNACYSEVQAQALVAHVPCVIGMSEMIGDEAAIIYAASFYRALAFRRSVANAHQQGLAALALHLNNGQVPDIELPETALCAPAPRLLSRPGIDADDVYLVHERREKTRCVLVIKATLEEFNADVIARVTEELRKWTSDVSLQITDVDEGSVRLSVSLSRKAAKTLMELRANGQLAQVCGFDVSDVFELPAAKIKAQAAIDNARMVAVDSARMVATNSARMVTVSSAQRVTVGSPQKVAVGILGSFAEIAEVHRPLLHRVALRLSGNAETAKDLVQETLLRALRRFDEFQQGTHAATWLVAILTNLYRDDLKYQKVVRRAEPELTVPEAVECDSTIADISDGELYDAVKQLDPELRDVVELCYFKLLRYHQAAMILNVPVGTIGTRLMRARTQLRKLLMDTKPR
jgi:RNA polymerase sigma factor (sigma-70 family)